MSQPRRPRAAPLLVNRAKIILTLIVTAALLVAVVMHLPGLNGPSYWQWGWRNLDGWRVYPLVLLSAAPLILAQYLWGRSPLRVATAIGLLTITSMALELTARAVEPAPKSGVSRVADIVMNPDATGYFMHAWEHFVRDRESVGDFLGRYPQILPGFTMHPRIKPPGPILFYLPFLRMFPDVHEAAYVAGMVTGFLAALSVAATWLLIRTLTGNSAAAFHGASFMALCPGFALFFPEFDQIFPVYTMALVVLWALALQKGRYRYAIGYGLALAFVTFQTYNLLVLGAFLAGWAVPFAWQRGRRGWIIVARQGAAGLAVCAGIYILLYLVTGFNPIVSLQVAIADQADIAAHLHRPWPKTIPFDLLDFLLGMGWLSGLLAVFYVFEGKPSAASGIDRHAGLVALCVGQPVLVALLGILPTETARVWIFMMPLVMVLVGLELTYWSRGGRCMVYGCLAMLAAAILQNMAFI